MTPPNPTSTRLWLVVGLGVWFVIVHVLSVLDFWQRAGIVIPKVVGLLVVAQLLVLWRVPRLRELLIEGDPRWLLSVHTMRFVGILFLVMHARGELPWAFAVPGGCGDIVIATWLSAAVTSGSAGMSISWKCRTKPTRSPRTSRSRPAE